MLKSVICNGSVPYKLVKRTVTAVGGEDKQDEQGMFRN